MREAFFILLVLAILLGLTAIRYRKQIVTMLHIWRSLKSMREKSGERQVKTEKSEQLGPLVNCSKCGTWVPEQRAIKLRGGTFYCSSNCLETAAKTNS
ncbi:MAG: hypothetical protein DMF63_12670 [Acidobacteria bacterium]|nr:MAG: hypothetical protein DMF63_12670 [Acidobacteriota bacterium]